MLTQPTVALGVRELGRLSVSSKNLDQSVDASGVWESAFKRAAAAGVVYKDDSPYDFDLRQFY